jgi:hypothetical protein
MGRRGESRPAGSDGVVKAGLHGGYALTRAGRARGPAAREVLEVRVLRQCNLDRLDNHVGPVGADEELRVLVHRSDEAGRESLAHGLEFERGLGLNATSVTGLLPRSLLLRQVGPGKGKRCAVAAATPKARRLECLQEITTEASAGFGQRLSHY